jgi:hypothetical protein
VTEKPKHPTPQAKVFQLSWETEAEPATDAGQEGYEDEQAEDDVEGHASGFHRPE